MAADAAAVVVTDIFGNPDRTVSRRRAKTQLLWPEPSFVMCRNSRSKSAQTRNGWLQTGETREQENWGLDRIGMMRHCPNATH
jgi:hypothetical protein